jgi:hypothetical protein
MSKRFVQNWCCQYGDTSVVFGLEHTEYDPACREHIYTFARWCEILRALGHDLEELAKM